MGALAKPRRMRSEPARTARCFSRCLPSCLIDDDAHSRRRRDGARPKPCNRPVSPSGSSAAAPTDWPHLRATGLLSMLPMCDNSPMRETFRAQRAWQTSSSRCDNAQGEMSNSLDRGGNVRIARGLVDGRRLPDLPAGS